MFQPIDPIILVLTLTTAFARIVQRRMAAGTKASAQHVVSGLIQVAIDLDPRY